MKQHTFNGKKYIIEFVQRIDGLCDTDEDDGKYNMYITQGKTLLAELDNVVHEGMHALGVPSEYVHQGKGTRDLSRFILSWLMTKGYVPIDKVHKDIDETQKKSINM